MAILRKKSYLSGHLLYVPSFLQTAEKIYILSIYKELRIPGRGEGVEGLGRWLRYTFTYLSS